MSSIAYVTDEKMLEYHRLCRNRSILFWRLSSRKKFTDFRKGDLLFFFARPFRGRKKALIGYAHFDSVIRLSKQQMWARYGQMTGYDSQELLYEALEKASKGSVPKQMSCLYLTDVVFFLSPIYPEEFGMSIPATLESYCYLDRSDPGITVQILNVAKKHGIDLWTIGSEMSPDVIFEQDIVRHQIAVIHKEIGNESGSEKERTLSHRIAALQVKEENWEMIRSSRTDCLNIKDNQITIAIPFTAQANDKDMRIRDFFGRMILYKLKIKDTGMAYNVFFVAIGPSVPEELISLTEVLNAEQF